MPRKVRNPCVLLEIMVLILLDSQRESLRRINLGRIYLVTSNTLKKPRYIIHQKSRHIIHRPHNLHIVTKLKKLLYKKLSSIEREPVGRLERATSFLFFPARFRH